MDLPKERNCTKCGVLKDLDEFHNCKNGTYGKVSQCKKCIKERKDLNKEYHKEYYKKYRVKNLEKIKAYAKEYHKKHGREYRNKNKDRIKEWMVSYRIENKDKFSEYNKKYSLNNAEKIKRVGRENYKKNSEKIKKRHIINNSLPVLFKTYAKQLTVEEDPIEGENGLMMCRCSLCREYFYPTLSAVSSRIERLKGRSGESRLYCSELCITNCDVHWSIRIPKSQRKRSVQARCSQGTNKKALLDLQFDNVGYTFCEKCGNSLKRSKLYIHHGILVSEEMAESNNISHQMILCKQ